MTMTHEPPEFRLDAAWERIKVLDAIRDSFAANVSLLGLLVNERLQTVELLSGSIAQTQITKKLGIKQLGLVRLAGNEPMNALQVHTPGFTIRATFYNPSSTPEDLQALSQCEAIQDMLFTHCIENTTFDMDAQIHAEALLQNPLRLGTVAGEWLVKNFTAVEPEPIRPYQ